MNPPSSHGGRFVALFLLAVVFSLAIHVIFYDRSRVWRIPGFSAESYDMIVPRTFRINHVEIDPSTLEEKEKQPEEKKASEPIILPSERPLADTRPQGTEKNAEVMKPPTQSSAKEEQPVAETIPGDASTQNLADTSFDQLMEGSRRAPPIPVDPLKDLTGRKQEDLPPSPFSSLDDLLDGKEKITSGTAPILMPTDLLFGYDSTTLKPEAEKTMEKLGTLIQRNASARFRIEGHTDSFGSDDYNNALSLKRAQEVKAWLVSKMDIDPARITTSGMGKSRLLVSGTGSIEQQQLNRRVEIVITQTGNPNP